MRLRFISALLAVLGLAVGVVACSDDSTPPPSVEFGEGEVPETFPDDFPIPANARIGSTLIDRVNHRSEASMTVPSDLEVTVRFFTVGLVNQGYVVDRSEGDSTSWAIEFRRGEVAGDVLLTAKLGGTQAVASMNTA